jgi:cytoskeletal protein RodZ
MRVNGFNLRAVAISGALGVLVLTGAMCQKSQSEKTQTPQPAVTEMKTSVNDSAASASMAVPVDTSLNKTGAATEYYTCTMHPQVHQAKPGKCPICGMDLVLHAADATTR